MKVHIKSFGCQMNKLDSALVSSSLKNEGYELTDSAKDANAVLINTCSVREHAEERVFSHLGHLSHMKKEKPDMIVAVFGCMAQRLGDKLMEHPAVDIVAGPAQIPQLAKMVSSAFVDNGKMLAVTEQVRHLLDNNQSDALEDFETVHDGDDKQIPGQAFVRAMRGCNKFCTYCIVPYVRGPEVSRPPEMILEQVRRLAGEGVKQITLLGQTINRYLYENGKDVYKLADLLGMVSEIDGIEWVRFITSHPAEFDDSILRAMADIKRVCPYLHVPAQSGSDRILKAMNRNYTAKQYIELVERARDIVPEISISSDFIVGFPGETDGDFDKTVELVKRCRFKNSFIFKYSQRPGTTADKRLEDDIDAEIKKERNLRLLELQNIISEEDNKKFMNKTVKVLVEGLSKKPHLNRAENNNMPQLIGRMNTDHIVVFNGNEELTGNFADVEIYKAASLTLFGKLV